MDVLNKFDMLILSASLLAACGNSGSKGSSDEPVEQVAQNESSPTDKYEKALNEFPEADPKLAGPIVIPDKKSPDGLAELQKFNNFITGEETQKIGRIGQELQQSVRQNKETEAIGQTKELAAVLEQFHQSAAAIDIKDPEIKVVLDRTVQVNSTINEFMTYGSKYTTELTIGNKDKEIVKFTRDFQDKSQGLQGTLRTVNQELQKAAETLSKEYSQ